MKISKRGFLKLAGIGIIGISAKPALKALASGGTEHSEGKSIFATPKRLALVIDMRKCKSKEGCRDCIDACHSEHNVPQFDNPKDEIKWIWKEDYYHAFPGQEHPFLNSAVEENKFLVLCNHCDNPPCVRVCPTKATWKRKEDGVVAIDWHRCVGCRFCVVACPYGSRSFNWRDPRPHIPKIRLEYPTRMRGVAEKCTFCVERLAKNLPPACVEACKEKAMIFGDLEDPESEVRAVLKENFAIRRKAELGTLPQVYYIV